MKHPEDDWGHGPHFGRPREPDVPFDAEPAGEGDSPEFAAIRHIELLVRMHHMAFRCLFQENGLPPAQAGAMRIINRCPGLSQRELADKLHIQRATATVMLQKMEKSGHIDRRPDLGDQRISRIYPTPMAKAMEEENQKKVSAYFTRCFDRVSPEELAALRSVMEKLGDNLRAILQETPDPIHKE